MPVISEIYGMENKLNVLYSPLTIRTSPYSQEIEYQYEAISEHDNITYCYSQLRTKMITDEIIVI